MRRDLASRGRRPRSARRPAAIGPRGVSTPTTRSPSRRRPVTGVCWNMSTPRCDAPAAYAQATRSWRAVAPSTWCDAAQHRVAAAAGQVELRDELLELRPGRA